MDTVHNNTLYMANVFDAPSGVSCCVMLLMITGGNFSADYHKKRSLHATLQSVDRHQFPRQCNSDQGPN